MPLSLVQLGINLTISAHDLVYRCLFVKASDSCTLRVLHKKP